MAHEISIRADGYAEAMYANSPAWHGLGRVLDHVPTSEEAIRAAGLDWNVAKKPLRIVDGEDVTSHVALVREDSGGVLGVVGTDYGIVQNTEAFSLLDSLAMDGSLKYESAMALRGGRIVLLLARMPNVAEIVPGDTVLPYVLLQTSHDGTRSLSLYPTAVRVVCANTWRAAESAASDGVFTFRFRHTLNVRENAKAAVSILAKIQKDFDASMDQARALVSIPTHREEIRAFLEELIPDPVGAETERGEKAARTRVDAARSAIASRYYSDATCNLPGIAGTRWALFNAVTSYVDHERNGGRGADDRAKEENLFQARVLGAGAEIKSRALALLSK